jgi:hypothetical protein
MSLTALRPADADTDADTISWLRTAGPSCGLCPDGAATETAFLCELCDEAVCGYCAESAEDRWLCPECARRTGFAS